MQLVKKFFALDDQRQVHTVAVYKEALGSHIYRLDDREAVEPLDEKWFVTLAGRCPRACLAGRACASPSAHREKHALSDSNS